MASASSKRKLDDIEDDINEEDLPTAEVCEERCQSFAAITNTDVALAQCYLQDRQWNLQASLNAFFQDQGDTTVGSRSGLSLRKRPLSEGQVSEPAGQSTSQSQSSSSSTTSSSATTTNPAIPMRFKIVSWNVDGLDQRNLVPRGLSIVKKIKEEQPDVVFLQEVINDLFQLFRDRLSEYLMICGNTVEYYTAILLKRNRVNLMDHEVTDFDNTVMGRNLLVAKVQVENLTMRLVTTHLESCKEHSTARKEQLKTAFKIIEDAPKDEFVFFGGDLNIRDSEIIQCGGVPRSVADLWEATGSRPEAKYTWDCMRNTNLGLGRNARARFDRLYWRKGVTDSTVKPVYFELIGLEKVPNHQVFPSDHWGIQSILEIQHRQR